MGLPSKLIDLNKQITAIRNSGSEAELPLVHVYTQSKMIKLRLVHGINSNRPLAASAFPFIETW